jgi:Xaa-Pro aminopeptidase
LTPEVLATSAKESEPRDLILGSVNLPGWETKDCTTRPRGRKHEEVFIYIPEEGFGIRIENDIVVNDQSGAINLMADTPVEADEIEQLMNAKSKAKTHTKPAKKPRK